MLCQQAHPSIIFLCCSRAEDSQRPPDPQGRGFQQRYASMKYFAVRFTLQQAMQQQGVAMPQFLLLFFG
jgi:hypothetical protein